MQYIKKNKKGTQYEFCSKVLNEDFTKMLWLADATTKIKHVNNMTDGWFLSFTVAKSPVKLLNGEQGAKNCAERILSFLAKFSREFNFVSTNSPGGYLRYYVNDKKTSTTQSFDIPLECIGTQEDIKGGTLYLFEIRLAPGIKEENL
jgi:hypothetical protein